MLSLNPNHPQYKNLMRELRVEYKRLFIHKPWSKVPTKGLAKYVENKALAFGELFGL
jgi:hypothetical protein